MTVKVLILQRPKLVTATGAEHQVPAEHAALLSMLVMTHPEGVTGRRLLEKLGFSSPNAVESAVGRFRRWLEGVNLGVPKHKRGTGAADDWHDPVPNVVGRYRFNPRGGFVSDWDRFQELIRRGLPSSYATGAEELADAWNTLGEIVSLFPPSAAGWEPLPALKHTIYYNLVLLQVMPAVVARGRTGLALGRADTVVKELEPIFGDNAADELLADALAQAHAARNDRAAALRVLQVHEEATSELDADVSDAIQALRQRLLRPSTAPATTSLQRGTGAQETLPAVDEAVLLAKGSAGEVDAVRSPQLSVTLPAEFLVTPDHRRTCTVDGTPRVFEGDWFQLTYAPSDSQLIGAPWSIELVTTDPQEGGALAGSWSRVWSENLQRSWSFNAFVAAEGTLTGRYDAVSDTGAGSGVFGLTRRSCCVCSGWFIETRTFTRGPASSYTFEAALLVWLRGSFAQRTVGPKLLEVQDAMSEHYTSAVLDKVARLLGGERSPNRSAWEAFRFGAAYVDLTPVHAPEVKRRRDRSVHRPQPDARPRQPEE